MAHNKHTSSASAGARDLLAETVTAGAGNDVVVNGGLVVEGAVETAVAGQGLSPEIVEQLSQAADNLETARAEVARLTAELATATSEAATLKGELSAAGTAGETATLALESERRSHEATRARLDRALAAADRQVGDGEDAETDAADWVADGLFVMKTSKIPDETGALAPRGRLAIIGDKRAEQLVDEGHARPATRADMLAAKRPPVRI